MRIADAEQIATLPWAGNFAADQHLFECCSAFIEDTKNSRDARKRALYLMTLHGMGIDEPVTDESLDAYIAETSDPHDC